MSVTVQIQEVNGEFQATLLGAPEIRSTGPTRADALNAVRSEVNRRRGSGEIVDLELEPVGISDLAGTFRDDPLLQEICDEIYRERDRERDSLNFE